MTETTDKLLEFQRRVSAISKDSVNPFFKSKYFDVNTVIDTIKPILNEVGLVVTQPFQILEGKNVLRTEVYDENKLILSSVILLPDLADVQKFGAAITYFRRYALVSLLLLQGEEDDDANKTQSKPKHAATAPNIAPDSQINEIVPGNPKVGSITKKQALFIKSLRTQRGLEQIADEQLRKMSPKEASEEIKRLQEEVVIQVDQPYVPGHEYD